MIRALLVIDVTAIIVALVTVVVAVIKLLSME